jgi:hypothetical protein
MGLGEVTKAGIYTKDVAHRPPSHMTLMGKVLRVYKRPERLDNQIPGDPACETGTVGAARRLRGFQHSVHVTTMCVALWQ